MTSRSGLLTLTTDFGARDHYVGAMKGVVATLAPEVRVVDITHGVPAFDVAAGAFAVAQAHGYFPAGTVHVVVVDPGVGSARRPIAVRAGSHFFVAPDNGVLSQVAASVDAFEARWIRSSLGLGALSRTFHGRDLFAPVGARLASGLRFSETGSPLTDIHLLPGPDSVVDRGRVLHVDAFGNIVTSFREADVPSGACLSIAEMSVCLRAGSYAEAPAGRLFLIVGSSGYVEVSLNRDSAASALGVRTGDRVVRIPRSGDQSVSETL